VTDSIAYDRDSAVATITLNRPDALNALTVDMKVALLDALRRAASDDDVRAVVLTGAGRAFCVGQDLREHADTLAAGHADLDTVREHYNPLAMALATMPKPVVAAVNGPAAGIGLSLALACDLVVAAESAFFQLAFVNIGLVPDGGSSLLVPSRVGFARAAELALLGERLGARKALDWGLINRVWPDEEFGAESAKLLDRLAGGATMSYAGTKRQLNRWLYEQMEAQLEFEAQIQREMSASADFAEGVRAFAEKRPARFTGA